MDSIIETLEQAGSDVTSSQATDEQAVSARLNERDKLFSFSLARPTIQNLVNEWQAERSETEVRRKTRKIELDVEKLRQSGEIGEDETFIPVRVIDTNIQREQPPYINYLKNSRRLAIFKCVDNHKQNTQQLEAEFTEGMSYLNWETPHFKCLDGSQTHGWDAVEIVYDESKPLHCAVEHIGHDKLFFPKTAISLQDSPELIREYNPTRLRLESFITNFGFNPVQVNMMLDKIKDSPSKSNETLTIYKRLFKHEGIVHVAWFALSDGVSDWLKQPEPLYIGIDKKATKMTEQPSIDPLTSQQIMQQVPSESWEPASITIYPIAMLPYRESEEPTLTEFKGRVFLDENKQEACTSILSAFVNRLNRSANIYGSPSTEDGTGAGLKELSDIKLTNGKVLNRPFTFWSMDGPDPMILTALEYLDQANANETNQVNFAVNNRQDSRKTAKEISSSEQQQSLLNGVQLTLFSTYIRTIYSLCWLIAQSQAMQNKIKLLQIEVQEPQISPIDGSPIIDPATGQPIVKTSMQNNVQVISYQYNIKAAGDVDVVQRQEKIAQMKQDWPVIAGTPLAAIFLADLMRLEYPESGDAYAEAIMQGDAVKAMQGQLLALDTIMEGIMAKHPEVFTTLPQESQMQLKQILSQVKSTNQAQQQQPANAQQ